MRRGRPTKYTPEIARRICDRLANGESLKTICKDPSMPPETTVIGWHLDNRDGFSAHYTRAREIQAQLLADQILAIADDGKNDKMIDEETGREVTNHDVINRSRLRVDTRKWYLSKVLPKIYGDKIDLNHSGEVGIKRVIADL